MGNTFKEVAIQLAKKQPHEVDNILEEAPILGLIPFEPASHGFWNVYEELEGVTGPSWGEMDAPLSTMDASGTLNQVDLNILGGILSVPEDRATVFGGPQSYVAKKKGKLIKDAGMTAEVKILYDNLRAYALAAGGEFEVDAGGAANTNYTIIAVRFIPGEVCGLYNPSGFGQGSLMDWKWLDNGGLRDIDGKGTLGYSIRAKSHMGFQIASSRAVGIVKNVDIANDALPTAAQIDDLLASIRATPGSTYLMMHYRVRNALNALKGSYLEMGPTDMDINRMWTHWAGIPVVCSYNFEDGDEDNA